MDIQIDQKGIWYHGSNVEFAVLREGSTVTQWKALAEAFSHKPTMLGIEDDGTIFHNGKEQGVLYIIDEPVELSADVVPHPRTTMEKNAEFLTTRPLKVKRIGKTDDPRPEQGEFSILRP